MVTRRTAPLRRARVLFICGTHNQTTQLHAVARQLPEVEAFFTPFYSEGVSAWAGRSGLLDRTILGNVLRARCEQYLEAQRLPLDVHGQGGPYDLVITCTDLLLPRNVRSLPVLVVQEGMLDEESAWSHCVASLRLPPYLCGTTLTGVRGRYTRMCLASEGFRAQLIARGAPAEKLRVTGIPNFDDCARFRDNDLPERGYVLVCTSDLRETFRFDRRARFLVHALRIARGRPLHFKFHPNEDQARARREVLMYCPRAHIHDEPHERTEALIANCAVLITQVSSVTFVGLALGKEVHSDLDVSALRRLLPLQNGGSSARNIAGECRELLSQRTAAAADGGGAEAHA